MEKKQEDNSIELTNSDEEALLNEDTPKTGVNKHYVKTKAVKKAKEAQIDIDRAASSFALRINLQTGGIILKPSILGSSLNTPAAAVGIAAQQNLSGSVDKKADAGNSDLIATAATPTTDKEKKVANNSINDGCN